jgi:predicted alpha/beta hydrolase
MSDNIQKFTFEATDGYSLAACHYRATEPIGLIIVASATGVPQEFYRKFAEYASKRNYDVVTFDYRGIGKSAPSTLRGFEADFSDWASKDLKSLVDILSQQTLPLYLVGHSYGGHAVGLIDNHHFITAACFLGTGAGWHGWMPLLEQVKVKLLWEVVAPLLTRYLGYLGLSALGMGEDLPLGVYKQWKRWCKFPNYFFGDTKYPEMKDYFSSVRMPIKAINSVDDKWAPPISRDAFMLHYSSCVYTSQNVEPNLLGISDIGHMGYFRGKSELIWSDILDFFASY